MGNRPMHKTAWKITLKPEAWEATLHLYRDFPAKVIYSFIHIAYIHLTFIECLGHFRVLEKMGLV